MHAEFLTVGLGKSGKHILYKAVTLCLSLSLHNAGWPFATHDNGWALLSWSLDHEHFYILFCCTCCISVCFVSNFQFI